MIALLDTETTGTDPAKHQAIEVAVVTMSVEPVSVLTAYSSLIRASENPAESVNGIPSALLPAAPTADAVWTEVRRIIGPCKAILAHKADFDRSFVPQAIADGHRWICTLDDIQWPRAGENKTLVGIALAHGLGVSHAHRALTDCLLLARLLERVAELGHDVKAMLRRGLRPKGTFRALVSFENNALAKSAGFRWDPERKWWVRSMAIEDVAALPFKTVRVDVPAAAGSAEVTA